MTRGVWVEALARLILELEGFSVEQTRLRLERNGVSLAEVDILARKNGEAYAVEVKSGRVSVTDVRQVYANAALLGAKPLLIARGFSDEAAKATAEELGVKVLLIPDYVYFVDTEELLRLVEEAVALTLEKLLSVSPANLSPPEVEVVKAIASSSSFEEAARRLGVSTDALGKAVEALREKGAITLHSPFRLLRLQCKLLLLSL
ncbi:restriction endonuclease [Thermofilum pendens]|uniref:Recombinase RecB n=1 Tax=Thermofilum pendens (strain DSM 2475 / Hrk 5) TaxID=368408 RepID=A1RWI2_THEPD|nr:restriction endonuclease [Thermofilum pendens]ABL77562.1 conserved hypothetical protein [Thermofilum pendens Hrk 5]